MFIVCAVFCECVTVCTSTSYLVEYLNNTALIWQKEASDKSDISRKRAKCVCQLH